MIFVDTSFWIGLIDDRDGCHAQAVALTRVHERARLVTTNHVLGETWTLLRRRHGHRVATAFLDRSENAQRLEIEFTTEKMEAEAWEFLRRRDERKYSFVDATSFAHMRHFRIREAFAFDGDFAAAGFVELRA